LARSRARVRLGSARARQRRHARAHAGLRPAVDGSPERRHRLVDGPDAAHTRRRHDQGADERRPRARPARAAVPPSGVHSRPEWRVFGDAMARAFPDRSGQIRFDSAAAIRGEIARAVPLYAGIETLRAKGDQVQWGGRTLYQNGRFATPDGKAHFSTVSARVRLKPDTTEERLKTRVSGGVPIVGLEPDTTEASTEMRAPDSVPVVSGLSRTFFVSTRRGKQFNSAIPRGIDPLTGAS